MESDYTMTLPPLFIKSEPEPLTVQEDVKHTDTKNLLSAQSAVRGLRHLQLSWISDKHQQGGSIWSAEVLELISRFFFLTCCIFKNTVEWLLRKWGLNAAKGYFCLFINTTVPLQITLKECGTDLTEDAGWCSGRILNLATCRAGVCVCVIENETTRLKGHSGEC